MKETITISKKLFDEMMEVIREHQFWYDEDGESYNDDDVIDLVDRIEKEIKE